MLWNTRTSNGSIHGDHYLRFTCFEKLMSPCIITYIMQPYWPFIFQERRSPDSPAFPRFPDTNAFPHSFAYRIPPAYQSPSRSPAYPLSFQSAPAFNVVGGALRKDTNLPDREGRIRHSCDSVSYTEFFLFKPRSIRSLPFLHSPVNPHSVRIPPSPLYHITTYHTRVQYACLPPSPRRAQYA